MKLNNKGFALTSIIYMLIVLFLMIMLLILANLAQRKVVLDKIKSDVKQNLNQGGQLAKNTYTVTFDPTIGQINQTTKQVTYNEPYGELPTPTREGYKFIGWRGKNAFNPQKFYEIGKNYGVNIDEESIILTTYPYQENYTQINLGLKNNTQYTLSYNWLVTQITQGERIKSGLNIGYDDGTTAVSNGLVAVGGALDASGFKTLTSGESKNLSFVRSAGWQWSGTMKLSNIQLEEGTEATQYEPYQEYTSDTVVTKQENHTLYAMWEPLYTVTFDANGGTLTENSKYVAYNEPYGELPTPTREEYRFIGWRGKNMFTGLVKGISVNTSNGSEVSDATRAATDYIKVDLNSNNYYLSGIDNNLFSFVSFYNKDKEYMGRTSGSARDSLSITPSSILNSTKTDVEGNVEYIRVIQYEHSNVNGRIDDVDNLQIQLELGDTATSYEPYQEYTSDTMVTKKTDHTLYAIWQANE